MPRAHVLRGARLSSEPRRVRAEDLVWPGLGPDALAPKRQEPLIYSERDVEALLENVRREALAEGRASGLEEGRAQGYDVGHQEGLAAGREQEHEKLREGTRALTRIADGIVAERRRVIASAGGDLVQLAMAMAERIVRRSLPLDEEAVLRAIREALDRVADAHRIVVRLNPREMELVEHHREDLSSLISTDSHLELRADASVAPGGCLVDTAELRMDATVEALLERFEAVLADWCRREANAAGARPDDDEASDAA